MAFGVQDFHDLMRLLEERPEWRADLRRLVLTEDLLDLPARVRELAEQVQALAQAVGELAAAQQRTEVEVAGLAAAQQRTEVGLADLRAIVGELAAAQQRTEVEVAGLTAAQRRIELQVDGLRGSDLERRYREHAGGYFGRLMRRVRVVSDEELDVLLEAGVAAGALDEEAAHDVRLTDLIVRGRRPGEDYETFVVVEVSFGIGPSDVERVARRARLVGRLRPALAAVAGEWVTPEAERLVAERGVWRALGGQILAPSQR